MPKVRAALLAGLLVGCGASSKGEPPKVSPAPSASAAVCPAPVPTVAEATTPASTPAAATPAPPSNEPEAPEPPSAPPTPALAVVLVDDYPFTTEIRTRQDAPAEPTKPGKTKKKKKGVKKHPTSSRPYHPAPGIIVDVTAAQGVTTADAQRLARAEGYWPFRRCYEEGLRRNQDLGGKVAFELTLGADGNVQSAHKTATNLRDESVALCVVREGWHLPLARLPGAASEGGKKVSIQVTLATGDEPVPMPRPLPDSDRVREALRTKWPAVEKCYREGLARHRDLGGRLTLRIRARSTGELAEVGEVDPRFADIDVTRCVLAAYRGLKLPKLAKEETFSYAVHLEAKEAGDVAATSDPSETE